jgi:hypothetical protein
LSVEEMVKIGISVRSRVGTDGSGNSPGGKVRR